MVTTCTTVGSNVNITIGDSASLITAVVSDSDPPVVHAVGLGNVNGVTLSYQEGVPPGSAQATRDGHAYHISGTATGVDNSNPGRPVTKPFTIDVRCP
jgi:lipoprotein LpqH